MTIAAYVATMPVMNPLQFDDSETEAVPYRTHQPAPTVAPWFAYLVGTVMLLASTIFVVQMVRLEIMLRAVSDGLDKVSERAAERYANPEQIKKR